MESSPLPNLSNLRMCSPGPPTGIEGWAHFTRTPIEFITEIKLPTENKIQPKTTTSYHDLRHGAFATPTQTQRVTLEPKGFQFVSRDKRKVPKTPKRRIKPIAPKARSFGTTGISPRQINFDSVPEAVSPRPPNRPRPKVKPILKRSKLKHLPIINLGADLSSEERATILNNYRDYDVKYSLDGKYFNRVIKDARSDRPGVLIETPLHISITQNQVKSNWVMDGLDEEWNQIISNYNNQGEDEFILIRVIFDIDLSRWPRPSRHSNLLIIDPKRLIIERFEPLDNYEEIEEELKLNKILSTLFSGYPVLVDERHPQKTYVRNAMASPSVLGTSIPKLCMVYLIKYASDFIQGRDIDLPRTEGEAIKYGLLIEHLYGVGADQEYGYV